MLWVSGPKTARPKTVPPNYFYCRQCNVLCLKVFTITTEQPDNCFETNEDIAFAVNILQNSSNI